MSIYREELSKFLTANDLHFTAEREELIDKIAKYHKHFEAEKFFARLKKEGLKLSRPTYYRNLNLFVKAGLIAKSNLEDGRVIYEHLLRQKHHDHFVCLKCGQIIEFYDPNIEIQRKKICNKYGFQSRRHQMQIFGLCRECGKKNGDK